MNDQNTEIERYRKLYSKESDAQLIATMQSIVPHAARHIAAKQLLAERKAMNDEKKHLENMTAILTANRLSILAVIIALIALSVSIFK